MNDKTLAAFDAALQGLLEQTKRAEAEQAEFLTAAVYRLTLAADQYALAQAKVSLVKSLESSEELDAKRELGGVLESLVCCPPPAGLAFGSEPMDE